MFPLTRTKNIFAGLIVLNLLLIAGFAGLYYFLNNRAQAANRLSAEVDLIRNQQQREEALDSLVNETTEARAKLDNYFVGANASADFITLIENIGNDTRVNLQIGNVSINSNSSDTAEKGQSNLTETLVMELQASGNWDRVVHFTRVLELLPQETAIRNVSFSRSGSSPDDSSQPMWSVTATIEVQKLTTQ